VYTSALQGRLVPPAQPAQKALPEKMASSAPLDRLVPPARPALKVLSEKTASSAPLDRLAPPALPVLPEKMGSLVPLDQRALRVVPGKTLRYYCGGSLRNPAMPVAL
jgi:hypothetical protein